MLLILLHNLWRKLTYNLDTKKPNKKISNKHPRKNRIRKKSKKKTQKNAASINKKVAKPGMAVILIDMQEDFIKSLRINKEQLISNQVCMIRYCRHNKIPLVILEYEGHGSTIDDLMSEAKKIPTIKIFRKKEDNGFIGTGLESYLKKLNIKTLFLMGINADACVMDTGEGAIKRGFKIATANSLIAGPPHHRSDNNAPWYRQNGLFANDYKEALRKIT